MKTSAPSVSEPVLARLVDAVSALDPQPRKLRWTSITFCVVDAVFSIGARYDSVVVPLVTRVADNFDVDERTQPAAAPLPADPIPLDAFLKTFGSVDDLVAVTNRQKTSTRGGILKADAVIQHANILAHHGVRTLADAQALLTDTRRLDAVETDLRTVRGEGAAGVRRGYLWMLVGADDAIKPDRMVLRWLEDHDVNVNASAARDVLRVVTDRLNSTTGRQVTLWEVDHAIWSAARRR